MNRREFLKLAMIAATVPMALSTMPPATGGVPLPQPQAFNTPPFSAEDFLAAVDQMQQVSVQPDVVVMHPEMAKKLGFVFNVPEELQ